MAKLTATCLRLLPGNPAFDIFYKQGFYCLRKHYLLPIPDETDLTDMYWDEDSKLIGLDMNDKQALNLLQDVFPRYTDEFRDTIPIHQSSPDPTQFYLINGTYMAVDAHVYYIFIRHFKPKRIIEIGSGNSTIVAATAAMRNLDENGEAPTLIAIEPFPSTFLKKGLPGLSRLIEDKVQNVDLELFTSLEAGDILFIDSSHVLRSGGDVQREYLEILPRLAPGILVHIHDISLPKPYPRVYFENQLYWNEQYLLQAFLSFNARFEVLWPGNYMMLKYPEIVCNVFPEFHIMREAYPMSEPSSFWIRSRKQP